MATAAAATAVPVMVIVCGLLLALSVSVRIAVRAPVAVGVNVILIVQFAVGITVPPLVQVVPLAIAKSPAFAPLNAGAAVKFRLPFLPVCRNRYTLRGARRADRLGPREIQRRGRIQCHGGRDPGACQTKQLGRRGVCGNAGCV